MSSQDQLLQADTSHDASASVTSIFPLDLTPLELLFWVDDSDACPMVFVIEMIFRGRFCRPGFEAAWSAVLSRHPLLQAVLVDEATSRPRWVPATNCQPAIDWHSPNMPRAPQPRGRIDLRCEIGIRISVHEATDTTRVDLHVHHACCDGVAGIRLVEDFLVAYAQWVRQPDVSLQLRPLKPEMLPGRDATTASVAPRRQVSTLPADPAPASPVGGPFGARVRSALRFRPNWDAVRTAGRFLLRRPRPLAVPRRASGAAGDSLLFTTACMPAEQLRNLRRVALAQGASLNDLLIRDVFLTLDTWNKRFDRPAPARWLRLTMPTNLRGREHEDLPAANLMSYSFLDRRGADCEDPEALLKSVSWESQVIQKYDLSRQFLFGLSLATRFPRLFRWAIHRRRCLATAVLTYLGDPTRRFVNRLPREAGKIVAGDVVLEQIAGCPPIRDLTRVALTTGTYGGELTLGLRCDARYFTEAEAKTLMDDYIARLTRSAALARPSVDEPSPSVGSSTEVHE